jgi:hypothetical protein
MARVFQDRSAVVLAFIGSASVRMPIKIDDLRRGFSNLRAVTSPENAHLVEVADVVQKSFYTGQSEETASARYKREYSFFV